MTLSWHIQFALVIFVPLYYAPVPPAPPPFPLLPLLLSPLTPYMSKSTQYLSA